MRRIQSDGSRRDQSTSLNMTWELLRSSGPIPDRVNDNMHWGRIPGPESRAPPNSGQWWLTDLIFPEMPGNQDFYVKCLHFNFVRSACKFGLRPLCNPCSFCFTLLLWKTWDSGPGLNIGEMVILKKYFFFVISSSLICKNEGVQWHPLFYLSGMLEAVGLIHSSQRQTQVISIVLL